MLKDMIICISANGLLRDEADIFCSNGVGFCWLFSFCSIFFAKFDLLSGDQKRKSGRRPDQRLMPDALQSPVTTSIK